MVPFGTSGLGITVGQESTGLGGVSSDSERQGRAGSMFASSFQKKCLLVLSSLLVGSEGFGQEHGRIKRKPPTELEAARIASDIAMNDSLLRKGDIVVTDRGFFAYRGVAPVGVANDFVAVPNPLASSGKK
jgi:hypothetical protein